MQNQARNLAIVTLIAALVVVTFWRQSSGQGETAKPAATVGRYQLSSWGSASFTEGRMRVASGAYIIDSETGEVYMVTNDGKPTPLGTIPKK